MGVLSRIGSLFGQVPREQVLGYSPAQLQALFTQPMPMEAPTRPLPAMAVSLASIGVPAYYCSMLIDQQAAHTCSALIESGFTLAHERVFNDRPVRQYHTLCNTQQLIAFSSPAFNAVQLQWVSNSQDLLQAIEHQRFAVPPPWIAFDGYDPQWWGGAMQGAQGHYNERYFSPFFAGLNPAEKRAYYAHYQASAEWINCLESLPQE